MRLHLTSQSRVIHCLVWISLLASVTRAQTFKVGVIEFYGARRISMDVLRGAIGLREGDPIAIQDDKPPEVIENIKNQLLAVPGVAKVKLNSVCCEDGAMTIYVGIVEKGTPLARFRPEPKGEVRLPAEIVRDGEAFEDALLDGIRKGDAGEDRSKGYSLMTYPPARRIQEKFPGYAARYGTTLHRVVRFSKDSRQRALAVQVIAYTPHRDLVIRDLLFAVSDPNSEVRNNAIRALMVMLEAGDPKIHVPVLPLLKLLKSPDWTDRNKSLLAIEVLTRNREPGTLALVRRQVMPELKEMAAWRVPGHSYPALMILSRLKGIPETEANRLIESGRKSEILGN